MEKSWKNGMRNWAEWGGNWAKWGGKRCKIEQNGGRWWEACQKWDGMAFSVIDQCWMISPEADITTLSPLWT